MKKIIVIEGSDGCGKQTQTQRLKTRLEKEGRDIFTISIPNYNSISSGPLKLYLQGALCKKNTDFTAYQASSLFAIDRLCTYQQTIKPYYLDDHTTILLDRYTTSNLLHQGATILQQTGNYQDMDAFADWICNFEFNTLQLPRPNQLFYLHVPSSVSINLMEHRANKITGQEQKDILESDEKHLHAAEESGLYFAKKYGWTIIECMREGTLRTIEDIHEEIYQKLTI